MSSSSKNNKAIIDATADLCIAYKPNLAFYESMGVKGWIAFEKTVKYIKENYPDQLEKLVSMKRHLSELHLNRVGGI